MYSVRAYMYSKVWLARAHICAQGARRRTLVKCTPCHKINTHTWFPQQHVPLLRLCVCVCVFERCGDRRPLRHSGPHTHTQPYFSIRTYSDEIIRLFRSTGVCAWRSCAHTHTCAITSTWLSPSPSPPANTNRTQKGDQHTREHRKKHAGSDCWRHFARRPPSSIWHATVLLVMPLPLVPHTWAWYLLARDIWYAAFGRRAQALGRGHGAE